MATITNQCDASPSCERRWKEAAIGSWAISATHVDPGWQTLMTGESPELAFLPVKSPNRGAIYQCVRGSRHRLSEIKSVLVLRLPHSTVYRPPERRECAWTNRLSIDDGVRLFGLAWSCGSGSARQRFYIFFCPVLRATPYPAAFLECNRAGNLQCQPRLGP